MLARVKSSSPIMWLKKKNDEKKRQKDLKRIAKNEKLWDLRLKGYR